MEGSILIYFVSYTAIIIFLAIVITKFIIISKMPLHLRWELYPIESNKLKVMVPEMLFLVSLYKHNKKLWWRSFPFHFGLYLLTLVFILLLLDATFNPEQIQNFTNNKMSNLLYSSFTNFTKITSITKIIAAIGLLLTTLGVLGLLHRRIFDQELRQYTAPADIFNLCLFLFITLVMWGSLILFDPHFILIKRFLHHLFYLNFKVPINSYWIQLQILLFAFTIVYVPLTHMSHFFTKWFTYHNVRWDDDPNVINSKIEKKIIKQLNFPINWSAPHIKGNGTKTWSDIATEEIDND